MNHPGRVDQDEQQATRWCIANCMVLRQACDLGRDSSRYTGWILLRCYVSHTRWRSRVGSRAKNGEILVFAEFLRVSAVGLWDAWPYQFYGYIFYFWARPPHSASDRRPPWNGLLFPTFICSSPAFQYRRFNGSFFVLQTQTSSHSSDLFLH